MKKKKIATSYENSFSRKLSKTIDLVYNELSINFLKLLKSGKNFLSKKNAFGENYKKKDLVFHRVFHNLCKKLRKLLWKYTNAGKKGQWAPRQEKEKDPEEMIIFS